MPKTFDYLSPAQFACYAGISTRTVYQWIYDGRIRASKFGGRLIRIPSSELENLLRPFPDTYLFH
jgi:excisionase family DNA binding protein